MQEYADPVIDWLDAGRGILPHRFFRDVRYFPLEFTMFTSKLISLYVYSLVPNCQTAHTQKTCL
jgi:hypothetical protein